MFEKIHSLRIEEHPAALQAYAKQATYQSPLASPVIPWALVPASYVTEHVPQHYFPCKEEFLAITRLLIRTLGMPSALCVLSGTLAGAMTWEGVSIEAQYRAVMESAGVFEASGMTYLHIHGPDAEKVLNRLVPRDVSTLTPGSAMFVVFTTPFGTVDNEAIVLRISQDAFLLSCCGGKPLSFLHQARHLFPNVAVTLADTICFNIKGPKRVEAMQLLLHASDRSKVATLPVFQFCQARFLDGTQVWIVKTKIGVEMWGQLEVISQAWQYMLARPELYTPCGWDILHVYRMECTDISFSLYPLDIHHDTSLWEIGCGWMIAHKHGDYIGKNMLRQQRNTQRFTLQKIKARSQTSNAAKIGAVVSRDNGDFAGYVTSSAFSVKAGCALAFAHLTLESRHDDVLWLNGTQEAWQVDGHASRAEVHQSIHGAAV